MTPYAYSPIFGFSGGKVLELGWTLWITGIAECHLLFVEAVTEDNVTA